MPKSKRNKTVDLSKTKKHGLEGKKELYKKIQSNVENFAHVFVFAVNDMRNSKMKNVREQWKHSSFCIGKNKVMAMALGRTPEEEYRPNLHKVGQMLVGERGLLFTNQSVEEVTNWFQSYSEGDYARSGNIATEDVILPEGPLLQFPHSLESYLRQLGLPTTLKKGVIHLIKEHVVCTEGDILSPETARILKLLGYEMAEFRIRILSVWSQDGSFVNLQTGLCDPEFKENLTSPPKSFMKEDFELAKDCLLLGDDGMEVEEFEDENEISDESGKETDSKIVNLPKVNGEEESLEAEEPSEIIPCNLDNKQESEQMKSSSKEKEKAVIEAREKEPLGIIDIDEKPEPKQMKSSSKEKEMAITEDREIRSSEMINIDDEPEPKQMKSSSKEKDTTEAGEGSKVIPSDIDEKPKPKQLKSSSKEKEKAITEEREKEPLEMIDIDEKPEPKQMKSSSKKKGKVFEKLEESAEKPKKFSPKLTRARAAAQNKKIKTPEPLETKRSSRKRKM